MRTLRRGPDTADPVVQGVPAPAAIPAPLASFEGISNQDNFGVYAGYVIPPDTVGDVGPNHYVQAVNLLFRVFNKTGTALTAPLPISTLFASIGGICATTDDGDPIVLYDPLADRWLITQFADATPAHQCVALSRTGDPTGSYFLYDFPMPNNKFNDYPKFGVWPDAYYMSDNQFAPDFQGAGVFAFNRTKMLAGDPSAGYIYFDLQALDPTIGSLLPADVDGLTLPAAGAPNVFAYFTATEFADAQDGLRLFNFHADFATPGNSTFTERPESPVLVASFDPTMNESSDGGSPDCSSGLRWNFEDDIPQPDASGLADCRRLDSLSDRLMFRLQYRNFGTHESLVTTHSVDVNFSALSSSSGHKAGVRYYELRRALPGGSFAVNEQASFAPDTQHRWMGSAAMDASGDIAVGYSVSGSSTFPSIRYAGRLAGDPPNGLAQGETTLQAGSNLSETTLSRWGDYSMMAVDPVDECTFWYTTEYTAPLAGCTGTSTRCWRTRVGSFRFPSCATPARGTIQGTVTDAGTTAPIAGARVVISAAGAAYETGTGASGTYSRLLSPGSYTAVASAPGYTASAPAGVVISNGNTTTQNFALVAIAGPTPTATPLAPTATPTRTPTNTPTRTPTPTPVPPSVTPSLTPTNTPTTTPSPTPTNTPTGVPPSVTPSSTPTRTPTTTPSSTPTSTPTGVPPSVTPSSTPTRTPTTTPSSTPTNTPTGVPPSVTPSVTPSATPTSVPGTSTPTPPGPSATPTRTSTPTPTGTPTPTPSTTSTPSPTPSSTPTATPSLTPTVTPNPVPGATFYTLSPCRIADTRLPNGAQGGPALIAGESRVFGVGGICGVSPTAKAVAVNVTVVNATNVGNLTLYPAATSPPLASTLNFRASTARANNAVVALGASGSISALCSMPSGTADFVLDVTGYFE